MNSVRKNFFIAALALFAFTIDVNGQGCCSGGSGSPIAGGASQGVLPTKQLELAANYQYLNSGKFLAGSKDTVKLFNRMYSNYLYFRAAYGIYKDLTMSVEGGYFVNKTIREFHNKHDMQSSGIGDLLLFPRYELYNKSTDSSQVEVTIGLGYKIPLGSNTDSTVVYTDTKGVNYYTTSPPTIQATNGSQDLVFYAFALKGYPKSSLKFFANAFYVKKGWNSIGQKFGDYLSLGLFASKVFDRRYGITLQLKGEWMDKMKADKNIDMLALYNVDTESTGGYKVFVAPQFSYTYKMLTAYVMTEIPVFQFLNGTQVASQYQFTAGVSYRFCL